MSGSDGNLVMSSGTLYIDAGSIKRYNSVTLSGTAQVVIRGWSTFGTSNPGHIPTLIGCKGNFSMSGSAAIYVMDNAGAAGDAFGDQTYSFSQAHTVPWDFAYGLDIGYIRYGGYGGCGGETGSWGTYPGCDGDYGPGPTGHGGGGAGYDDGGYANNDSNYGYSGYGGASGTTYPTVTNGVTPGFGAGGITGYGGEVPSGISVGGGGSGGVRGLSGGCLYIQIGGVATIPANSIYANGSDGGYGGDGGPGFSLDNASIGGGGGGGGAAGGGGFIAIRYKSGTVDPSCASAWQGSTGAGGVGGLNGVDPNYSFQEGQYGSTNYDGAVDIATY
jgi:hypothetical protein